MAKWTMHDEILCLLKAVTTEEEPMTQPEISERLRFESHQGSRALVLNELQEKTPYVHKRQIMEEERMPQHGRAEFFWWYDESKKNNVFGKPRVRVVDAGAVYAMFERKYEHPDNVLTVVRQISDHYEAPYDMILEMLLVYGKKMLRAVANELTEMQRVNLRGKGVKV